MSHMDFSEAFAAASQWITGVGVPALAAWFARQKWKDRNERARDRVGAVVEVATAPDKIVTSSVVAVESRMVAMVRAWDSERNALQGTIDHQGRQLIDERAYSASRDELIAELRAELEHVRKQLDELTRKIDIL